MNDARPKRAGDKVDELRQQLRSLGYLDAGVDRFVLGSAREARRPATIALLASLRVGLLGALLLGPAAAIGIGGRVPGLITGPRDALVVALYLAIVFGAAAAVVTFAAALLLASAGGSILKRPRSVALGGGILVSIACLAYLTLWWRMANPDPVWSSPIWTALALASAAGISLLLGHAVTVTALAAIVARDQPASDAGQLRASSTPYWKLSLGAGVLAFAGAALLLVVTAPADGGTAPPPPLTVVSSGARVRVIAIDGFDPALFEQVMKEGPASALARAFIGARAELAVEEPGDPARVWTTIATGQLPAVHGVHGLETRRVAGVQGTVQASAGTIARLVQASTDLVRLSRPAIASGQERRAKTMWEVAAGSGLRTVVVNWWATWPAPVQSTATIVTDRAVLRLERGGPLDAEIAPSELYDGLRAQWSAIRASAAAQSVLLDAPGDRAVRGVIQRSAELDALQLALSEQVRGGAPDLEAVYLPGLDIAQHALFGTETPQSASALAARVDALRAYYVFLDRALEKPLTPAADEIVFLVTSPGRSSTPSSAWLAIMGRGRAARTQQPISGRAVDVAPTILYALGLPHSRELAGKPLRGLFAPEHIAVTPAREVPTYGPPSAPTAPRGGQPLDAEMLERLRSLGYVR